MADKGQINVRTEIQLYTHRHARRLPFLSSHPRDKRPDPSQRTVCFCKKNLLNISYNSSKHIPYSTLGQGQRVLTICQPVAVAGSFMGVGTDVDIIGCRRAGARHTEHTK